MSLHALMFGWEYPPLHCGGLGVACQGIVRGLLHHGAQVTLVLPSGQVNEPGVMSCPPLSTGETFITVPSVLRPYDTMESYASRIAGAASSGVSAVYDADLPAAVARYADEAVARTAHVHPDVIHSHDWLTMDAGLRAARAKDKPLVVHVHATELDRTGFRPNQWIYDCERRGFAAADHVIAVSGYTKNILSAEYGVPASKVSVVHNGINPTPVARAVPALTKNPVILYVGRLTAQKGVDAFLRAAAIVTKRHKTAKFVVAGDGHLLPQLVAEANALGLGDRVLFAGRVNGREAEALYASAACFVMPSVSEPFGLVALEAITHGAPVILSRQSGAKEVVKNALLVDFWDTDRMADCILTVLREKPLVEQMRTETPRILRDLSWPKQAAQILSIYRGVADRF